MSPASSFMSTSALTTAFFTQPVTWVWLGLSRLLSLWLIRNMCKCTNINKCTGGVMLHKSAGAWVHKSLKRRQGGAFVRVFAGEIHIQNIAWILFDIQSGCVKAAVLIGTRDKESIEPKHLEWRDRCSLKTLFGGTGALSAQCESTWLLIMTCYCT